MKEIKTLKTQAKHLVRSLGAKGIKLTLAQALEGVAAQYGFDTWDALVGSMKSKAARAEEHYRNLSLADVDYIPDEIRFEQGAKSVLCDVGSYDTEGLALLRKPAELAAYLATAYDEGAAAEAILLFADREDFHVTFRDLEGVHFTQLGGRNYWYAPKIDAYLEIMHWAPPAPPTQTLTVPELVKGTDPGQLIVVPSADGPAYDGHVLVPAHVNATDVARKLEAELVRLKAADRTLAEDEPEYTEEALGEFVKRLGCKWVVNPVRASETWD